MVDTSDKDDKVSVCFVFFFSEEGEVCCSTSCNRGGKNLARASQPWAFPCVRALRHPQRGCHPKASDFWLCQEEGSAIGFVCPSSPLTVGAVAGGSYGLSLWDSWRELRPQLSRVGNVTLRVRFIVAIRYSSLWTQHSVSGGIHTTFLSTSTLKEYRSSKLHVSESFSWHCRTGFKETTSLLRASN